MVPSNKDDLTKKFKLLLQHLTTSKIIPATFTVYKNYTVYKNPVQKYKVIMKLEKVYLIFMAKTYIRHKHMVPKKCPLYLSAL